VFDDSDIAEVEALIDLVNACRAYAAELAVNEATLRVQSQLRHYLDTAARRPAPSRHAAVGFAAKIFGSEYAAVLLKAAAVAAHGIRRPRKPDTPLFRLILRLPRCGVAAAGPWRFARCGGPAAVM